MPSICLSSVVNTALSPVRQLLSYSALLLCSTGAYSASPDPSLYDIYYGDANGDYQVDLYFEPSEQAISDGRLAPEAEAWVMLRESRLVGECREDHADCSLGTEGLADYQAPLAITLDPETRAQFVLLEEGVDYWVGDINGDGQPDVVLRGADDQNFPLEASDYPQQQQTAFGRSRQTALGAIVLSTPGSALPEVSQTLDGQSLNLHNVNDRSQAFDLLDTNSDGKDELVVGEDNATMAYDINDNGRLRPAYRRLFESTSASSATLVGHSAGEFSVSETGAARYRLPLALPGGTAGLTPSLSFNFSSSQGNGLLGKRWQLGGLSAITRCRPTVHLDGQAAAVNFTERDRFCYNGQRLIATQGAYGAVGTFYKTQIDAFITVQSVGGTLGRPEYFRLIGKDGVLHTFGGTADARQQGLPGTIAPLEPIDAREKSLEQITAQARNKGIDSGSTMSWNISQQTDSVGNQVNYRYHSDPLLGHRLHQINYAYGAGTTPNARVELDYEDRPDEQLAYTSGQQFATRTRLKGVRVYNTVAGNTQEVRRYQLHYLPTDELNPHPISYLAQVQECVGQACLPATTFEWSHYQPANYHNTHMLSLLKQRGRDGSLIDAKKYYAGDSASLDINGDGVLDRAWFVTYAKGTNHRLYYALAGGLQANGEIDTHLKSQPFSHGEPRLYWRDAQKKYPAKLTPLDYNADGYQDLAVSYGQGQAWRVYLSVNVNNQRRLSSQPIVLKNITDRDALFIDLNADGLVDVLAGDTQYLMGPNPNATAQQPYALTTTRAIPWTGNQL